MKTRLSPPHKIAERRRSSARRHGLGPRPFRRHIPHPARAGLTVIEMVISSGIIAVLLLASAAAMGENVESSEASKRLVRGAVFLESVQEDLASLSTSELLALNGQRVYSDDSASAARFRCEVTCFYSSVQTLQVELKLVDQVSSVTTATLHTLKAVV